MWYLHAELEGHPAQMIKSTNRENLIDQKTVLDAGGWTCTLLDQDEQDRMAYLTAQLIEKHPNLAD